MRSPKEKAEYLVDMFEHETCFVVQGQMAKQCALIAVRELIKEELRWLEEVGGNESESEWQEVKAEIEKL